MLSKSSKKLGPEEEIISQERKRDSDAWNREVSSLSGGKPQGSGYETTDAGEAELIWETNGRGEEKEKQRMVGAIIGTQTPAPDLSAHSSSCWDCWSRMSLSWEPSEESWGTRSHPGQGSILFASTMCVQSFIDAKAGPYGRNEGFCGASQLQASSGIQRPLLWLYRSLASLSLPSPAFPPSLWVSLTKAGPILPACRSPPQKSAQRQVIRVAQSDGVSHKPGRA